MRGPDQPDPGRRMFLLRDREPEVHIASCIVQLRPARIEAAIPSIESLIGWPVSASNGNGKLVVVLEGSSTGALLDQMERIRAVEGVLNIELVYQHAEAESVMKEPMQ